MALVLASPAAAQTSNPADQYPWPDDTRYPVLNFLASEVAGRHVEVACPSAEAWGQDFAHVFFGALGYTYVRNDLDSVARVDPVLCAAAALPVDGNEADAGLGLLVVTHEALHMRWWRYRAKEARVECAAIKLLPSLLEERFPLPEARRLFGFALAFHYWQSFEIPEYVYKPCRVPLPWSWAQP